MAKKLLPIQSILSANGPMSSNELAQEIVRRKLSINPTAARKVIQRAAAAGHIESTSPVRFDKLFLYYLDRHRNKGKGQAYSRAVRKLLEGKPAYNRVFKTLLANKGWITRGQIGKLSASLPEGRTGQVGGRKSIDKVIEDLISLGLLDEVAGVPKLYRQGKPFGSPSASKAAFLLRMRIEQDLLNGCRDWMRNTYLLAYDANEVRASGFDAVPFNDTYWDLHGPLYLGPFTRDVGLRRTALKENFLAVDILAFRSFTIVDAQATIARYKSIVKRWKTIAVTPIVISRSFSENAWNTLRKAGIGAVTLGDVYGKNIDTLLQAMWKTISDFAAPNEQIDDIKKTLAVAAGTVDDLGLIGNLKGSLFELLIALAWRIDGYDIVQQKVIRKLPDDEYEIDVVATRSGHCKLIECKGRHAQYREPKEELSRHFKNRCEAAADRYGWNITTHYTTVEAIFVTSGDLDDEARDYAQRTQKSHGIKCTVLTRPDLVKHLGDLGNEHLCDIIDRYYLDPLPLANEEQEDSLHFDS